MGQNTSRKISQELDYYPIRLEPEQSVFLYGIWNTKTTLTWRDVLIHQGITMSSCVQSGIDTNKLYRMQPDIKEWIKNKKATLADCPHMTPWKPNPFTDLGCTIGELALFRKTLTPKMLIDSGIIFATMRDRYGLTIELMMLLKYSINDWLDLKIEENFLRELTDDQWLGLFGLVSRHDILQQQQKLKMA